MHWMLLPLKRYADFQGRSRRREFWLFTLGYAIVIGLLLTLSMATGGTFDENVEPSGISLLLFAVLGLVALALIVPTIAVQVRRFHDQDKSGWLVLLGFIPYVGGLIVLVFMCLPGTVGPNRFGEDPKNPVDAERVFG